MPGKYTKNDVAVAWSVLRAEANTFLGSILDRELRRRYDEIMRRHITELRGDKCDPSRSQYLRGFLDATERAKMIVEELLREADRRAQEAQADE